MFQSFFGLMKLGKSSQKAKSWLLLSYSNSSKTTTTSLAER
jgi:hypothetical protein